VQQAITAADLTPTYAEVTRLPKETVTLDDEKKAAKVLDFIAEVEDHDDVQRVSSNLDLPPELFDKLNS
jgi:transcriptional/translational regulatory protein YebC/TACO1